MSLPDHKIQTLDWMMRFELCSSMFNKRQRRYEIAWLKDTTPLLQFTNSILVIWSHYILMPSIANRQHQQNYFVKSFASHCWICTSYTVSMECCLANIEQRILNNQPTDWKQYNEDYINKSGGIGSRSQFYCGMNPWAMYSISTRRCN